MRRATDKKSKTRKKKPDRQPDIMDMEWRGFWPSQRAMLQSLARIAQNAMMGGDSPYPPADDWRNP